MNNAKKQGTPCTAKQGNPCTVKQDNPCTVEQGNPCTVEQGNPCTVKQGNPCTAKAVAEEAAKAVAEEAARFDVKVRFSTVLAGFIKRTGKKDPEVYKDKMSSQMFNKVINDKIKTLTWKNVVPLAVALELSIEDATILLEAAGLAFSPYKLRDVIVKGFITRGVYSFDVIDEVLNNNGCESLGDK